MPNLRYHGLAEYGLPLVTPEVPEFPGLVRDIQARPEPFGHWPTANLETAAVLLNQTGKAIITLAFSGATRPRRGAAGQAGSVIWAPASRRIT